MKESYTIRTLTPLFSYGADSYQPENKKSGTPEHEGTPEIRAASIRGQLRWWMEQLGTHQHVDSIFGCVARDQGTASKVMIRVTDIEGKIGSRKCTAHKNWSKKTCYLPGATFRLIVKQKRAGLSETELGILEKTIEAWLQMGTLGGRGTRGGGSLQDQENILTETEWCQRCQELLENSAMHLRLGETNYRDENEAREIVCDTLDEAAFRNCNRALGGIKSPRKTSPLRMRILRFRDAPEDKPYRIAALWTEARTQDLDKAIEILKTGGNKGEKKKIGEELHQALVVHG